jgi:hypothetical protein
MRELWLIRGATASAFDAGHKTRDWQAKRQANVNRVAPESRRLPYRADSAEFSAHSMNAVVKRYRVAFKGEVVAGCPVHEVKAAFAKRFGKKPGTVERIFSGEVKTLARDLDFQKANSIANSLKAMGAVVYVVDDANPVVPERVAALVAANEDSAMASEGDPTSDMSTTARVRHLNQIMAGDGVADKAPRVQRSHRLRYRFDTFMARGGASIFKVLTGIFVASLLIIGTARGLLLWLAPELLLTHEGLGFFGNLYVTFLELTDPGNMVQDLNSSPWFKVFAVTAGLVGIVMLSALIAFITTALDQKLNELRRGRSKVIEEDHTLILGWNEQRIVEILHELVIANESEKDACVVILADKDKEEIDDVLRLRVKDLKSTRIVTRSGDVSTLANLDMVSIESAKAVIVLANCDDTDGAEDKSASDAKGIQTVLATMGRATRDEDFSVVVEIFNPTHREIVRSSFPEHVVTVNTSDVLAKLLVQTSRSVGLSVVYNEILSFDGCEMYFFGADWKGATFGEAVFHFPDGVPIGIRTDNGDILINPEHTRQLAVDDEVLIIADDDSTIDFLDQAVAEPRDFAVSANRNEQVVERELMIGWNFKSPCILREFADYIVEGSQIDVLLKSPSDRQREEIAALNREIRNIEVRLIEKDYLSLDDLMSLQPFAYDNIIILAGSDDTGSEIDTGRVDSENIVALLLLRRIFSQYPDESSNTKLIPEILDSQNYALVARAGVQDVIISNRLISMIMAQISESRDIEKVYDDIFQEDGSEIYLKPASLYFDELPLEVSFADMIRIAQRRDEVCIGVKTKALENNKKANNGVQLIPEKNTVFTLKPEDSLVVVAEDEL